jgi:hypothetical protein
MTRRQFVLGYSLIAGLGEAATGLLLVAAPALALRLMRVPPVTEGAIFLRWVGVFVLGVGLAYLVPLRQRRGRLAELAAVWRLTSLLRGAVAGFVVAAVAARALPAAWLTVGIYDGVLAAGQLLLWRAGWLSDDD